MSVAPGWYFPIGVGWPKRSTKRSQSRIPNALKAHAQATILASFFALWNVVAGPGMTDQARLEREIAETRGYRDGFTKLV